MKRLNNTELYLSTFLKKFAKESKGSCFFEEDDLLPVFRTSPENLPETNNRFYDSRLESYEKNLHITFDTHNESELDVRKMLTASISPESKTVLELGSGTGRDSLLFLEEYQNVNLIMLEPAPGMLDFARQKLRQKGLHGLALQAPAEQIPLPDNTVDAVYSFGGFNEFVDKPKVLSEIERVSKPGSKILLADEGIPVWWRETDFYKVLVHTNPQFASVPPLDILPPSSAQVQLRWVIGETFWVLNYEVSEGEPRGNFDIPIPGKRGGTLSTRYFGKVEGVSKELRRLIDIEVDKSEMSEHQLIEKAVRNFLKQG